MQPPIGRRKASRDWAAGRADGPHWLDQAVGADRCSRFDGIVSITLLIAIVLLISSRCRHLIRLRWATYRQGSESSPPTAALRHRPAEQPPPTPARI